MKIALGAGHGPNTPGKRSPDGTLREYHFNSVVARYVADMLLHVYNDVEILLVHDDNRDVPLKERTDRANAWGADLYVDIHANAYGSGWNDVQGIETFVYKTRPPDAIKLAEAVQRNLIAATGRKNRGVKVADFHVLRETRMTSILIECGFMTNKAEVELLKSDTYRFKCAEAIVAGITETYGLQRKEGEFPKVEGRGTFRVDSGPVIDTYIINGTMYAPIRQVAESLGAVVAEYDNVKKHAIIKSRG